MTQESHFVGIDVSKARLDIAVIPTGEQWSVSNDDMGIDKIVQLLRKIQPVRIILEATGGMEVPVTVALAAANWIIIIMCVLFGILLPSIIQTEEQTLLEKFGDEYREYMQRTGRFLPRLRR